MNDSGAYKMSTIADRTGFSPAVLRAWERRHGLLEPRRTEGGHRLYTDDDLRVLQRVRVLLDEGRAIGEVAAMGRAVLLAPPRDRHHSIVASDEEEQRLSGLAAAFVHAAVELDEADCETVLDEAFATLSPRVAIERILGPALRRIGDLWMGGRCSVAGEHLASAKIRGRLLKLLDSSNPTNGLSSRHAICACLPDEQHEIGSLVTAYLLTRHHFHVTYLGAALPLEDLEQACRRLKPALVCLSVSRSALLQTHGPRLVRLVERVPDPQFILGGRGTEDAPSELGTAGYRVVSAFSELEGLLNGGLGTQRKKRS